MKSEKISLMSIAAELTKLARGPVPAMPADTLDATGNLLLSDAQELENRKIFRIFTEFYCGLQNAYNDETVFVSPIAPASSGVPGGIAGAVIAGISAAKPVAGAVAAPLGAAISAALAKPLGPTP